MFQQYLLSFWSLSLVYGSYELVAIWGAMDDHNLTVVVYTGYWWCFNNICCHFDHWAWCMGHTSWWQFGVHWVMMIFHFHHWAWYMGHTSICQFWVQWTTTILLLYITLDNDYVSTKFVILLSCHYVIMSSCQHVIKSSSHQVIMSSCYHVIMLSCHHVIVS